MRTPSLDIRGEGINENEGSEPRPDSFIFSIVRKTLVRIFYFSKGQTVKIHNYSYCFYFRLYPLSLFNLFKALLYLPNQPISLFSHPLSWHSPCCRCGFKQKVELNERIYKCPECGLEIDKDLNRTWEILRLRLKQLAKKNKALADRLKSALPVDCGEETPVEWGVSPR